MSWKCPECGYQSRLEVTPKSVAFWCGRCRKSFDAKKNEFAVEDVTFHRGRDMFEPEVPPFVGFVQEYPEPSADIPYVVGADVATGADFSTPSGASLTLKQLHEMRSAAADLYEWERVAEIDKAIQKMVLDGVVVDCPTPSKGIVKRIPSTSPLAKRYGT